MMYTCWVRHIKKKSHIHLFIFGCGGSSWLYRLLSSCGERGGSSLVVHELPIMVAFVIEHRL